MPKKTRTIRINAMIDEFGAGIAIEKIVFGNIPPLSSAMSEDFEQAGQSHREDRHSFFLLESGTVHVEIDFQKYIIEPSSIIYMHPDRVHRILSLENVIISSWAIGDESLNPEYLKLLEDISPAEPLALSEETFSIISEAVTLCLRFTQRKTDKLYHSLLKDSCNALVALAVSQYLTLAKPTDKASRPDAITKAFRELLERNYTKLKRPAAYAEKLNLSAPYLNECVKSITGYPVSYHLQQRVILEAKRLLYHSDSSVKEIAAALGYDDYPYFSRLFAKVTGMSALTFRNKNRD